MASTIFTFSARNSGTRVTGLTPTFSQLRKLTDNTTIAQPGTTEVGLGVYKFSYDVETYGEAIAQIDCGTLVTLGADRYLDMILTNERNRITSGLNATGKVTVDLTQTVPTSNTVHTIGDALNAARAQGFGKWTISGTALTMYASDGSTIVKTFTLNSSSNPTSRS